ncbi:MAG: hypothetical protein ABSB78_13445 [Bacteroidota bacterium]
MPVVPEKAPLFFSRVVFIKIHSSPFCHSAKSLQNPVAKILAKFALPPCQTPIDAGGKEHGEVHLGHYAKTPLNVLANYLAKNLCQFFCYQ